MIAGEVRRHRTARKISVRQLSEAVERLGVSIPQPVLSNFELGRRSTVSVGELIVLAYVLKVPPLQLIYPVGQDELIEVLPGREVPTWQAAKWFTGEEPLPHKPIYENGERSGWSVAADDFQAWEKGAAAVDLARDHDRVCERWRSLATTLRDSTDASAEYQRSVEAELRRVEAQLALTRDSMRRRDLTPPELTLNLRHVDEIDPAEAAHRVMEGA